MPGIRRQLMNMAKEYKKDPSGQYKKHLLQLLDLHDVGCMTKKDVAAFVIAWSEDKL